MPTSLVDLLISTPPSSV